jgi:uncharacterized protein
MAKIESLGGSLFRRKKAAGEKSSAAEESKRVNKPFLEIFGQEEINTVSPGGALFEGPSDGNVEELLDKVHSRGEELRDHPTMERIKSYRESVAAFLAHVVRYSLEAETVEGARFSPLKKQKRYTLVRVVNEKLEKLAAGVLQNQLGQLEILRRVEEINGLLVDFLH